MSFTKNYKGYQSFQYLERDADYKYFELADEIDRVASAKVQLNDDQEKLATKILKNHVLISVHEHLGTFPKILCNHLPILRKVAWQLPLKDYQ